MHKRLAFARSRPSLVGLIAVLTLALGAAGIAVAATTWTVKPGGSVAGSAATTKLKDDKTGTTLTCKTSAVSGRLKAGSGLSGAPLGFVKAWSFASCTSPLGASTVTAHDLPYRLRARSYNTTAGETTGAISGIDITISGTGCSATVDGTAAGAHDGRLAAKFVNGTDTLSTGGGDLHLFNVSGCAGLLANGDTGTITAQYKLTPSQTITSP